MSSICENAAPFDLAPLLSRCMGNRELAFRLLNTFAGSLPKDIETIESLAVEHRSEQIAKIAHRLKGSAANLGAVGLSDAADQLEKLSACSENGDWTNAIEILRGESKKFVCDFVSMGEVST